MAEYLVNDTDMTAVADAIREKGGTSDALTFPGGFIDAVGALETGGGGVKEEAPLKDVNFYNYDGTRLYSYTTDEASALTELPPLPTVEGLTYTGWSWTLDEVNSLNKDDPWAEIVAFCYSTDGFWAHITLGTQEDCTGFAIYCYPRHANIITIDWGDGVIETPEYDKAWDPDSATFSHDYPNPGKYSIHVTAVNNENYFLGFPSVRCAEMVDELWNPAEWNERTDMYASRHYNKFIRCMTIKSYNTEHGDVYPNFHSVMAFGASKPISSSKLYSSTTKVLALPKTTTSTTSSSLFGYINAIGSYRIPDGTVTINQSDGLFGVRLKHIHIPEGVTEIKYRAFAYCYALKELTIPSTVTTLGADCFADLIGMKRYIIKATTPPPLSAVSIFNKIPADCLFYVPDDSIVTYQEATNWSTWADRFHGISELGG